MADKHSPTHYAISKNGLCSEGFLGNEDIHFSTTTGVDTVYKCLTSITGKRFYKSTKLNKNGAFNAYVLVDKDVHKTQNWATNFFNVVFWGIHPDKIKYLEYVGYQLAKSEGGTFKTVIKGTHDVLAKQS